MEAKDLKRGDIFHDGLLCYWIIHEKPKGKKLFVVPLDEMNSVSKKGECTFWHELESWNFSNVKVLCNLYENPKKAKALIGSATTIEQTIDYLLNPRRKG